jgi:GT2 family glycosyltransferase
MVVRKISTFPIEAVDSLSERPGRCHNEVSTTSRIGIAITTKDRWDDLAMTLERLEAYGLAGNETIVMDDGSELPAPQSLMTRFCWVRFERSPFSLGYVGQRNRLATMLSAPLYLSLDDDSFPIHGELIKAGEWLEEHPDAIGLAFPILETGNDAEILTLLSVPPYPVRLFVGCAHLLKRELFLKLGGYWEFLHYYCEEPEFTIRAWKQSYCVYHYPPVIIKHNKSAVQRNVAKSIRYWTRNEFLLKALHYPLPFFILNVITLLPHFFRTSPNHRRHLRASFVGFSEALLKLPFVWKHRSPLSLEQFLIFRKRTRPPVK